MKKSNIKFWTSVFAFTLLTFSCEDYLDVNKNPNSAITADVQLVLPQAIVASASVSNQFNSYGGHFGGMIANAGGFSGFGNLLNYQLTPGDYNGLWTTSYQDPLQDLKYVIDNTEGIDELAYFNAAAKIMTVVNYQRLVDAFGNIPFNEALRGEEGFLAPAYDNASDVYQDLFALLDNAIETIETAEFPLRLTRATDPLFGPIAPSTTEREIADQIGDWVKYANTLKLRILIRLSDTPSLAGFVTTGFAGLDQNFLDTDAIVDPGYELNRPNPFWNSWGRPVTGGSNLSNSSRIPTVYSFGFFNGVKIDDPYRGEAMFVSYPTTPVNQLGDEDGAPTVVAGTPTWYSTHIGGIGLAKSPSMGQVMMLAAESRLLQAEAHLKTFLPGGLGAVTINFDTAIYESMRYLYTTSDEILTASITPKVGSPSDSLVSMKEAYQENNTGYLTDITQATTDAQRLEAIITQKYIALMMINSDEAWNEYRRTGYPVTVPGGEPAFDIASSRSAISGRIDRLPVRIMYPSSEQSYNAKNYVDIDFESVRIFWDPN